MASTGSPPSLPKPPSRAVQMELQNRISLATSRMSFLQKYRSKRPQLSAGTPTNGAATTTTTTTTTTTSKAASFSSLAGKGRPAAIIENNNDDDEEDEPPLRAVPDPNTGLGHAPKAAAVAATAASRQNDKLRARLIGRQQKGSSSANDKIAVKRQRHDQDSSEDDEPGRSGLGRSKKQKRQPMQPGRSDDLEDDAGGDADGDAGRDRTSREQMQGPRPGRAEAGLDLVHHHAQGSSGPDKIDSDAADSVKRRKKKHKKNKKKENPSLS
ncbi:hypothetical protein PpBr36_07449 [Pyricularia pennisetigena]|uniref:hypothetical protein n=1 Tax=Pyricularia pennisetigena TaxID=1578925 RepID=UPI0011501381|nr:hypothetical protein PpBr36_07449 [Pyricularia pennisetigena]TLS25764.1 hypothetical protein PpBr36_07449 [Pyricularia pennisetigena]